MSYTIFINKPIRNSLLTFTIEVFGKSIRTERPIHPTAVLALLELPSTSLSMLKPNVSHAFPVTEHTAFAVAALLQNQRNAPESFLSYGSRHSKYLIPSLETYAELVFQGSEMVGGNLCGDIRANIQQRYLYSEEIFLLWRSAIQSGKSTLPKSEKTPWRLVINKPREEFGPYRLEILLDHHIIQSGAVCDLLPFMELLGLFRENFDDFDEDVIIIPLPQHRALPLIYFVEHAKRIRSADFFDDWDVTCDYLFKGILQGCPRWMFRESLRIVDQALDNASHDYCFAPYEYYIADSLLEKLKAAV